MNGIGTRSIALLVEYQGTRYGGSQYQENAPTVQDALERALGKLTNEPIRVAMAGRTDAGVHARGQVAAFRTGSRHRIEVFPPGTNAHLPADIAVRAAREVPDDFDPRRQARRRWYRYTLHLGATRTALGRDFSWHMYENVNLARMADAAKHLEGCHDFAAFTAPSAAARMNTVRIVFGTSLKREGEQVRFDIEATAYLPHMVRRIMGTLAEVGRGKLASGDFQRLVEEAPPGAASKTAPARGLCLMRVRYESGLFDNEADEDVQPHS
ncbi:MAG TPA: tRNA pseudouridine(38-40) synthase TruA [Dehalococcoidia bacterium]|nr:tRNA pseudouridine(38-40) synthase TruA [Dehalococcoidia bacterium]